MTVTFCSSTRYSLASSKKRVGANFRQVPTGQKQALVRDVFDTVAARYDLMNDLMSGGLHRVWKRRLVEVLFLRRNPTREHMQMADIAGGTGDIAFRAMRGAAPSRLAAPRVSHPGRGTRHRDAGEFVKANDAYILVAIGNAAWPIGVTSVGIHTRTAREKVEQKKIKLSIRRKSTPQANKQRTSE